MTIRVITPGIFEVLDQSVTIRLGIIAGHNRVEAHPDVSRAFLSYTGENIELSAMYYVYYKDYSYEEAGVVKFSNYLASILVQENSLYNNSLARMRRSVVQLDEAGKAQVLRNIRDAFLAYCQKLKSMSRSRPTPDPVINFMRFRETDGGLYERLIAAAEG